MAVMETQSTVTAVSACLEDKRPFCPHLCHQSVLGSSGTAANCQVAGMITPDTFLPNASSVVSQECEVSIE